MIEQADLRVTKNQLEEELSHWLLAEIEDRDMGLSNVSMLDIFGHTYDCRGQIDDNLVDEYNSKFNLPIDMTQGFNAYVEC
eukprot:13700304-Ditylum_brightwellii.AAC.1